MNSKRPTRHEIEEAFWQQSAYPPSAPDSRWTPDQLRAFIQYHDAQIAAMPKQKRQLRIDQLNDEQLHQLAQATSQAEADRLLDEFTKGQG